MTQYYNKKTGFIYKTFKVPHFDFFETKTAEEEKIMGEILSMPNSWGKDIVITTGKCAKESNDYIVQLLNTIEGLQQENVELKAKLETYEKHETSKESKTKKSDKNE